LQTRPLCSERKQSGSAGLPVVHPEGLRHAIASNWPVNSPRRLPSACPKRSVSGCPPLQGTPPFHILKRRPATLTLLRCAAPLDFGDPGLCPLRVGFCLETVRRVRVAIRRRAGCLLRLTGQHHAPPTAPAARISAMARAIQKRCRTHDNLLACRRLSTARRPPAPPRSPASGPMPFCE
jgi:hypothetical protein